ncbi:hypothetical protein BLNAU_16232 [Blattamonas nauphoetae]|uniref:HEAT repeat-containing protein 1 n=1 Tax=Blattamonas nauphoetae TaxID=2049346 RepID=A0ABQ9XB22_9EUKA|nr:hypothetical protein BLNAU_16232 [Blattamonas nauphoetae]
MVRFGSFLRYSCLLPSCLAPQTNAFSSSLPTHMLPSPALLNSTSPFLHTLILSILGCEKEDVIRQLAVSLPFILSHQGLLMEKEEKDKDRKLELAEKEKRKDDKSLDAFLTSDTKFPFSRLDGCPVALRRRLLASVQQVSSKEREKEADRLGSMVVRIVEKLLVVASNQPTGNLLSSFVSLLPAMVGKCHLTADQHSTIANINHTIPTLFSLPISLCVPKSDQFHLLSSLLPFFLSFTHTAPSNLALSSAFCFARTLRSVRQKRFRTQIVSSLIHSLAHSSSPKHKHTFLTLAASFFLCFSKRWCKVALLQSLGELLGDTNRSVANRARLFLPIIRTMLVLPQDQNFLPLLASSTPPLSTIPSQPSLPPSSKTVKSRKRRTEIFFQNKLET